MTTFCKISIIWWPYSQWYPLKYIMSHQCMSMVLFSVEHQVNCKLPYGDDIFGEPPTWSWICHFTIMFIRLFNCYMVTGSWVIFTLVLCLNGATIKTMHNSIALNRWHWYYLFAYLILDAFNVEVVVLCQYLLVRYVALDNVCANHSKSFCVYLSMGQGLGWVRSAIKDQVYTPEPN